MIYSIYEMRNEMGLENDLNQNDLPKEDIDALLEAAAQFVENIELCEDPAILETTKESFIYCYGESTDNREMAFLYTIKTGGN